VAGTYTDWTPLQQRVAFFDEKLDRRDPWQFQNIIVR
jgi:homospermidine synthase